VLGFTDSVLQMFVVRVSYLSVLQAVVARCGLPYASVVFELAADGAPVYGVEIDVPCGSSMLPCKSFLFWAPGYEQAALQAISFLQRMYGFVVLDYNFEGLVFYSTVARAAVSAAARATGMLGRLASERQEIAVHSEYLIREVSVLNLLV
jgi:hypothetical protein